MLYVLIQAVMGVTTAYHYESFKVLWMSLLLKQYVYKLKEA
jgi:hypothetical protein